MRGHLVQLIAGRESFAEQPAGGAVDEANALLGSTTSTPVCMRWMISLFRRASATISLRRLAASVVPRRARRAISKAMPAVAKQVAPSRPAWV